MKTLWLTGILISGLLLVSMATQAQWSTNPFVNNPICTLSGEQAVPKIVTCPNGDLYIGYYSNEAGNYNIRLQRLDVFGNIQWAPDGILISNHPQESWITDWDLTCDNANHAILVFNDIRTGNTNVVAYRISPAGAFVWGNDGILLSNTAAFNAAPKVCATSAGNIVVAWTADDYIIRQKLSPTGTLLWGPAGITMTTTNAYSWPQLMPVGTDEVIMKYFEDSGTFPGITRIVYAQRYNASGTAVWTSPTVISNASGISPWTQIFPMVNDGSDGFYITWHDDRDGNQRASVFVHHIGSNGAALFPANGVEASTQASNNHYYPTIALPPGSSDIYVFWNEMNSMQSQWGLYGQKMNASGALQWGSTGMTFIPVTTTNVYPVAARSTPGDVILIYEEYQSTMPSTLKAMRISNTGAMVWSPATKDICTYSSSKDDVEVTPLANNQWVLAWQDDRNGNADIFAQNLQPDGSVGPAFAGTINGIITLNGGLGNVTQVQVQAGTNTAHPDATGFYTMNVLNGTYTVTASLPGYQTASQPNVVVQTNQTTTVNLTLNPVPTGYIQGTVTLTGGFGIVQQVVVSAGTSTANPDQNGHYNLAVSPGTWDVKATLSGYYPDTVFNVAVANQQTVTGVNLNLEVMPTNGLITGTVTLNGGTGNVTQAIVSAGGGVAVTNPNASGFYTLDLPAGNYDVTASLAGYASQTITGVPVVVNQTTVNVNFTLVPVAATGHIQGHITITGEPANVTLTQVIAGGYSTYPNASGYYDLVVPAGTYNVTASHPYTNTATVNSVVVTSGQVTSGVDFQLTVNRADMIVKAVTNWGTTLNNVNVVIQGPEGPYTGTILHDSIIFLHVPYGIFNGTATWSNINVNADTIINAANHHLVFLYIVEGTGQTTLVKRLAVQPNPVSTQSRIIAELPDGGEYTFELTDINGIRLMLTNKNLSAGKTTFPLSDLIGAGLPAKGVYILSVKQQNKPASICRIIVTGN